MSKKQETTEEIDVVEVMELGSTSVVDVQRIVRKARAEGVLILGCSYCASMQPPRGVGPQPCPVCGTIHVREDETPPDDGMVS
jgi:hypothetical protein